MSRAPTEPVEASRSSNGGRRVRRWGVSVIILSALGALASLFLGGVSGCAFASSFRGESRLREIAREGRAGLGVHGGAGSKAASVTVGLTNAVLDGKTRAVFDDYTRRVIKSLPDQPGYVGHSVRSRPFGNEVWTMTVWRDESALDAFVASDIHRTAIRQGLGAVKSARFARFEWPADRGPPTWAEALRVLEQAEVVDYAKARRTTPKDPPTH